MSEFATDRAKHQGYPDCEDGAPWSRVLPASAHAARGHLRMVPRAFGCTSPSRLSRTAARSPPAGTGVPPSWPAATADPPPGRALAGTAGQSRAGLPSPAHGRSDRTPSYRGTPRSYLISRPKIRSNPQAPSPRTKRPSGSRWRFIRPSWRLQSAVNLKDGRSRHNEVCRGEGAARIAGLLWCGSGCPERLRA